MRSILLLVFWLLTAGSAASQTLSAPIQCSLDSQANQVCVGVQPDNNFCGCLDMFGACHLMPVYCRNVAVRKTTPDGHTVFTTVLGGESDQVPSQFIFDAQGNVVLFGTTYSKQFPTTPDAVQATYAGPTPVYSTAGENLPPGGDVFLSIISTAGQLLYSTFLGSAGSDTVLGVDTPSNGTVDALVSAGGSDFPVVPAGSPAMANGPVLVTFDFTRRILLRSGSLPIGAPGSSVSCAASMGSDGTVTVTTAGALYTFGHDGRLQTMVSLQSFAFAFVPGTYTDPAGDVWLVGENTGQQWIVSKLAGGVREVCRWTLPVSALGPFSPSYLGPLSFGPDGLTYVGGFTYGQLLSVTPNALLKVPCSSTYGAPLVAVFNPRGNVQMLSYLPGNTVTSFSANPDGGASAVMSNGTRVPIDLSQHPKAACVADALDRLLSTPPPAFGVGEIVRVRGGGFGPDTPVTVAAAPDHPFPTSLGSLSVLVAGIPAPILSASPGEVVFAIPFGTPSGAAIPVTVQDGGQQSAAFPIPVQVAAPWLTGAAGTVLNADGTPNEIATPAAWGSTLTIYLTGAGPYSPPLADGQVAPADTSHSLQLPVTISFHALTPGPLAGTILYAGPAPGYLGLAQINFQLPPSGPEPSPGEQVILIEPQLTIGSFTGYVPLISVR